jgi:hypothetical protein
LVESKHYYDAAKLLSWFLQGLQFAQSSNFQCLQQAFDNCCFESEWSITHSCQFHVYLLLCSSWTHLWEIWSFTRNKSWCLPVQCNNHHAKFCDWNEDVDCVFASPGMLCSSHRISGFHLHPLSCCLFQKTRITMCFLKDFLS